MGSTNDKNIARVRRGSDTLFMLALYRREDGGLQLGGNKQPELKLLNPTELASVKAKLILDGDGRKVDDLPIKLTDKHIAFELTKEMAASLGLYRIVLSVREADADYQDGYRDSTVATELCLVVREGGEVTDPKKIDLHLAPLAKGDKGNSAYQSYLDTTSDEPKMSEEEWATGGWLVILEALKELRGTKR
nr:hypothetical protein [uncultured Porphyromonas sp.]